VNGDGVDDLIVGAPQGDDGGTNAGEAYVIYGFRNPPMATGLPERFIATEDVAVILNLSAVVIDDVDPTGDMRLVIRATEGQLLGTSTGTVTATASDDGRTLTLTGTLAELNAYLQVLTNIRYLGAPNAAGPASDTLLVSVDDNDGSGLIEVGSITVDITPVADPPVVAIPLADQDVQAGTPLSYTIPADAFTDPDGDTLVLTAVLIGGDPLPDWLSFDAATGTFSGTPPAGLTATFAVIVTASDGGASVSDRFDITVGAAAPNAPPVVAQPLADQAGTAADPLGFVLPAEAFTDPDGDPLTLTATLEGGAPLPGWLDFDAATGTFSGTPPAGFEGTLQIEVTASDGDFGVADVFALSITDPDPTRPRPGSAAEPDRRQRRRHPDRRLRARPDRRRGRHQQPDRRRRGRPDRRPVRPQPDLGRRGRRPLARRLRRRHPVGRQRRRHPAGRQFGLHRRVRPARGRHRGRPADGRDRRGYLRVPDRRRVRHDRRAGGRCRWKCHGDRPGFRERRRPDRASGLRAGRRGGRAGAGDRRGRGGDLCGGRERRSASPG
jgi:hypothetical protein